MLNRDHIDGAIRSLLEVETGETRSLIRTPLLYPSGSTVALRITNGGPGYMVSDMGNGFEEAESIGAASLAYARQARPIADDSGVRYSDHEFFVANVSPDQLAGAVMAVANCSLAAAILTADHHQEREKHDEIKALVDRLERTFKGIAKVEPRRKLLGSSTYQYTVDAMVAHNDDEAVFDVVANHANSVFNTAAKFRDLGLLERPPKCFASVKSRKEMGALHGVLSQDGNVIERVTPADTLKRMVGVG